ncbi:MAG: DUF2279 domain-containing protein [Cyclobacteriaceae bacterium]|nr:DUF2279 domain-containing protein [Cyclobacteriaceae bacterium]
MTIRDRIKTFFKNIKDPSFARARIKGVLAFSFGVYSLMMLALGYAWYSQQWGGSFHFFNDAAEWKQMDKFAHFFWTFQVSVLATRLLTWAQPDTRKASIWGATLGFLFVSSIEIFDGFSQDYGASVYDVLANAAGCLAFISQRLIFKKIMVWPKFSFHPTAFAPLRPNMLGDGFLEEVLKDYNGQTFWYSASFKILPLPSWLTLAVGVGAEGMVRARDEENALMNLSPHRKYFLSFDLNLTEVKTSSKIMNAGLRILNVIKFPAPAIEISSEGMKFHPVYF